MKDFITNAQKFGMQLNKYKECFEKMKSNGYIILKLNCKNILDFGISKNVITEDEIPTFGVSTYPFIDSDVDTSSLDSINE